MRKVTGTGALLLMTGACQFLEAAGDAAGSARLYVDLFMSPTDKILAVSQMPLVQTELGLEPRQMLSIEAIRNEPADKIPAAADLIQKARKAAKEGIRGESIELLDKMSVAVDDWRLATLDTILSDVQRKRLQELMYQVDGLNGLCRKGRLAEMMELSPSQVRAVDVVCSKYDPVLDFMYHRLNRQRIAGLSVDETMDDRRANLRCWFTVTADTERLKEEELFSVLSDTQLRIWRALCGAPLVIEWTPDACMATH